MNPGEQNSEEAGQAHGSHPEQAPRPADHLSLREPKITDQEIEDAKVMMRARERGKSRTWR